MLRRVRRERVAIVVAVIVGIVPALAVAAYLAMLVLVAVGGAKMYKIPSSAMEPTLRCATSGIGCSGAPTTVCSCAGSVTASAAPVAAKAPSNEPCVTISSTPATSK